MTEFSWSTPPIEPCERDVAAIARNDRLEEIVIKALDEYVYYPGIDPRWLYIARTKLEQGFMALNRAILKGRR